MVVAVACPAVAASPLRATAPATVTRSTVFRMSSPNRCPWRASSAADPR
ncbi:hypothetical protein [Kitasatospora purpeofusca]